MSTSPPLFLDFETLPCSVKILLGSVTDGGEDRFQRSWSAFEYTMTPSRNRTFDSEVLGMTVGLCVNASRIDVAIDYGNQTEAPVSYAAINVSGGPV